ncbi:MAG: DUF285 domain-containing protein [Proteobacteria bacterium]|nr:DUF285 domain-containing protein [Pseudomonadota bacterium]
MKAIICLILLMNFNTIIAAENDDFIFTIKSDNFGGSPTEFRIKVIAFGADFNYNVDCNNDGINEVTAQNGDYTCDYSSSGAGTYTIRIKDNSNQGTGFPWADFNADDIRLKILSVDQWGTGSWTLMANTFRECKNVVINATDVPDFSNVTSMGSMFEFATLANPDTTHWNVSNVTNMSEMFLGATMAEPNTSNWNTSAVTNMRSMFSGAISANPDVSNLNVSNVTNMRSMFAGAISAEPDTSNWNVSKVTNMLAMFGRAALANPNTREWNVSQVSDMGLMFANTELANPDTSKWNVSNVIRMPSMFSSAISANPETSSWDTSSVTNMDRMFNRATSANPNTSNWQLSSVTNMFAMFAFATSANPDTSSWDTSSVSNMNSMFFHATSANPDISNWDISKVTTMNQMFTGVTLSTANYDAMLIGFNDQNLRDDVNFDAGNSQFCSAQAYVARSNMISANNWNIADGGRCVEIYKDGFEPPATTVKNPD